MKFDYRLAYTACAMIFGKTLPNKNWDFKPLSANPIKWSNTLKQFGCCRRIVCMCLTNKFLNLIGKVSIFRSILETQLHFLGIFNFSGDFLIYELFLNGQPRKIVQHNSSVKFEKILRFLQLEKTDNESCFTIYCFCWKFHRKNRGFQRFQNSQHIFCKHLL